MISIQTRGNYSRTHQWLNDLIGKSYLNVLDRAGQAGLEALITATPIESGETASSWFYKIEFENNATGIYWYNSHVNNGVNIAVILQYGHGTGTGGYVEGRDYINPAIQPIFDQLAEDLWREVTSG